MEKQIIMNDMDFRFKCLEYGFDWSKFEIINDVIVLKSPAKNIYVFFDKNYNTIGIYSSLEDNKEWDIEDIVKLYGELYNDIEEKTPYPFQNYSLKQIVDLANRINIYETNHGHSSEMVVNGDLVKAESEEDKIYVGLLTYVKFLGLEIQNYYLNKYQMLALGFEYPDIYSYLNQITTNIGRLIDDSIVQDKRPFPTDILRYLGRNNKKDNLSYINWFYDIINLLLKEKGIKVKGGFENYKELDFTSSSGDLSLLANKLLKFLELSDEELEEKIKKQRDEDIERRLEGLSNWFKQDIDDDLSYETKLYSSALDDKETKTSEEIAEEELAKVTPWFEEEVQEHQPVPNRKKCQ